MNKEIGDSRSLAVSLNEPDYPRALTETYDDDSVDVDASDSD